MNNSELTLIRAYFERIGRRLHAEGEAAKSFDHSTNKGQIREAFVREFLENNTSAFCGIGTGEIIHSTTSQNGPRNQIDVVVYNRNFPKLSLATGIDLFFIETVSSFIEVKSSLTKAHIDNTATITKKIKEEYLLNPPQEAVELYPGPRRPYSFIFAYDGPKKIDTLLKWMKEVSVKDDYNLRALEEADPEQRPYFDHLFIDGVFVLNRGFICVDSLPFQSTLAHYLAEGIELTSDHIWKGSEGDELVVLWAILSELSWRLMWKSPDLTKYIGEIRWFIEN